MSEHEASNKDVSCVICAHNEASTIRKVVQTVSAVRELGQLIVVDDGSSDATNAILKELERTTPLLTVVTHEKNKGKSAALASGLAVADREYVLLLDADLINLTTAHLESLLAPVLCGAVDVTISIRENSLAIYRLIGLDFVSGERAFPRTMIADNLEEVKKLPGYGFESFFNEILIARGMRLEAVRLPGVLNNRKYRKIGVVRGFFAEVGMIIDVLRVLTPWRAVRQVVQLLRAKRQIVAAPLSVFSRIRRLLSIP